MKRLIKYLLVGFLFSFYSCRKGDDLNFIENKTSIRNENIRRVELNRGVLTMKSFAGDFHVYSWCRLMHNDNDTLAKSVKDTDKLYISDFKAPYIIFKKQGQDFFQIIKNQDTLKFKIEGDK